MSPSARLHLDRAPQKVVSVLAGIALSLALVKWGISRRIQQQAR